MTYRYEFQTRVHATNTYGMVTDQPLTEEQIFWEIQKFTETCELVDINEEDEELVRGSLRETGKKGT